MMRTSHSMINISGEVITKIVFKKIFLSRCVNLIYGSDLNHFDSPKTSSYNILKASKQLFRVISGSMLSRKVLTLFLGEISNLL